jgi:hypothetical protein
LRSEKKDGFVQDAGISFVAGRKEKHAVPTVADQKTGKVANAQNVCPKQRMIVGSVKFQAGAYIVEESCHAKDAIQGKE